MRGVILIGALAFSGCGVPAVKTESTGEKISAPKSEPKEFYDKVAPMPREVPGK